MGVFMRTTDLSVNYVGFEPADEVHAHFYQTLNDLLDEAPAGSYVKATFSRLENGLYQGVLLVNSYVGPFSATTTGGDLSELLFALSQKVHEKLIEWKFGRFLQPTSSQLAAGLV